MLRVLIPFAIFVTLALQNYLTAQETINTPGGYARWEKGVSSDPGYFPIAVWLQSPRNAARFQQAGINLYIGLWDGPTEEQLVELNRAGMPVICSQNDVAMNSEHAAMIVGWMHGDEPDNAQPRRSGGYGPPIEPSVIEKQYKRIKMRDPTRPVLLNLGQGVAYDNYIGRGVRRNHPEDYKEYIQGCDIASFDIYPAVHDKEEVAGKLEFVAKGVERLRSWSNDEKIVWNCIEASRISNVDVKPTPRQIRAEVWMSLIHGSRGLIYFVHQFEPNFSEASLLNDPVLLAAVTEINTQIHQLAPALNSPTLEGMLEVTRESEGLEIATMCKRTGNTLYLFAVNMRNSAATTAFSFHESAFGARQQATVQVEGEDRQLEMRAGRFEDEFPGYGVHIYRVDLK